MIQRLLQYSKSACPTVGRLRLQVAPLQIVPYQIGNYLQQSSGKAANSTKRFLVSSRCTLMQPPGYATIDPLSPTSTSALAAHSTKQRPESRKVQLAIRRSNTLGANFKQQSVSVHQAQERDCITAAPTVAHTACTMIHRSTTRVELHDQNP